MRRPSLTLAALLIATIVFCFFMVTPQTPQQIRDTSTQIMNSYKGNTKLQKDEVADPVTYKQTTIDDLSMHVNSPVAPRPEAGDGGLGSSSSQAEKEKVLSKGKPIMAKMANETLRAELGRAGWKVFHTILAQYPEHPTQDERDTLETYIHMFSRVYPCRECAEHFQTMLAKYPPQTSSKEHASQWGCHVHNIVNKRLHKPIFDCNDISDKYACGCEDEENPKEAAEKSKNKSLEGLKIDEKMGKTGG